jgi:hypothetical protein
MQLLTKQLRAALPPLYANEHKKPEEVLIVVKFFTPWSGWTWFATEFDGKDTFFGMVHGPEHEMGYFSLSELQAICGPFGLKVERDMYYGKHFLSEVMI